MRLAAATLLLFALTSSGAGSFPPFAITLVERIDIQ